MGVDICLWRCRIGTFVTKASRAHSKIPAIVVPGTWPSLFIRATLLGMLLILAGDVELNPGPNPPITRTGARGGGQAQSLLSGYMRTTRSSQSNSPHVEERNADRHFDYNEETGRQSDAFTQILERISDLGNRFDRVEQKLDREVRELRVENERLSIEVIDLRQQQDRLESQSRRSNLLFHGIEPGDKTWEETETKVRDFMATSLNLDRDSVANKIEIERAHRLPGVRNPRPIIVKFLRFKDKDMVIKTARSTLKGTDFYVSEDFIKPVRDTRKLLQPFLHEAKSKQQRASLRYDKLLIEGVLYEYDERSKDIRPVQGRWRSGPDERGMRGPDVRGPDVREPDERGLQGGR
jgi:hypothetical protein